MGGFRVPKFEEEIKNLDKESEDYKAIVRRHEAIREARNQSLIYNNKLITRILELAEPFRGISRSKLNQLGKAELISIGKASKSLNDAMKDAGLITIDRVSDKFDNF